MENMFSCALVVSTYGSKEHSPEDVYQNNVVKGPRSQVEEFLDSNPLIGCLSVFSRD
jgi:hypothetical protein